MVTERLGGNCLFLEHVLYVFFAVVFLLPQMPFLL